MESLQNYEETYINIVQLYTKGACYNVKKGPSVLFCSVLGHLLESCTDTPAGTTKPHCFLSQPPAKAGQNLTAAVLLNECAVRLPCIEIGNMLFTFLFK